MDYLIRGLLKDRKVRFLAIRNTDCINEAISIKKPSDVVIALLGRTLAVGSMMGYMNKEDDAKISIRIQGTGKAELVIVDANTKGEVRGYVKNPYVFLPLKSNGHLDVGRSIGKGMITVIKDLGLKEPFHSEINIQSGEIGDDFSYYFAVSEQTPSVVGVGVLVDKDYSCKIGGGFIVQMLPDATDDDYVFVDEVTRKVTSVTDLLLKYDNLEELMTSLFGELEYVEELPIKYNCGCSKEKFMSGVATLEEEEILDMIEKDKGAELECQICGKKYNLTEEDLKECINIKKSK